MKQRSKLRASLLGLSTLVWTMLLTGPPQDVRADPSAGREPLSAAELAGLRGGFLVADGVTLDFAASVRTFVDGALALETNLAWTPEGAVSASTAGEGVLLPGVEVLAPALQNAGVDISAALKPGDAIALAGGGGTVLLHRTSMDAVQNFVFNTASNQDIRQEVDITLVLPGFEATQKGWAQDLLGTRLGLDLDAASVNAVSH